MVTSQHSTLAVADPPGSRNGMGINRASGHDDQLGGAPTRGYKTREMIDLWPAGDEKDGVSDSHSLVETSRQIRHGYSESARSLLCRHRIERRDNGTPSL